MGDVGGDEGEFGFVSRDQAVLDRVTTEQPAETAGEEGGEEGEDLQQQFRPAPEAAAQQQQAAGVTDRLPTAQQQGDSPPPPLLPASRSPTGTPAPAARGSMASVGSASSGHSSNTTGDQQLANVQPNKKIKDGTTEVTLPQTFQVKYLGRRDARGLWGIKHTRRPVDAMVAAARNSSSSTPGVVLPLVKLTISKEGVTITENTRVMTSFQSKEKPMTPTTVAFHAIDSISYGVQDLVYTRVFSMIVVRESAELRGQHPFECHAFVCDSRAHARKLTYALAAAFHEYSRSVRESSGDNSLEGVGKRSKKFAIDLRTPEQIEKDLQMPQEADSEA